GVNPTASQSPPLNPSSLLQVTTTPTRCLTTTAPIPTVATGGNVVDEVVVGVVVVGLGVIVVVVVVLVDTGIAPGWTSDNPLSVITANRVPSRLIAIRPEPCVTNPLLDPTVVPMSKVPVVVKWDMLSTSIVEVPPPKESVLGI